MAVGMATAACGGASPAAGGSEASASNDAGEGGPPGFSSSDASASGGDADTGSSAGSGDGSVAAALADGSTASDDAGTSSSDGAVWSAGPASADAGSSAAPADSGVPGDSEVAADSGGLADAGRSAADGALLATGDSRNVSQPSNPAVCASLSAQFGATQRSSPPASDDTSRIQAALDACAGTGNSVVLMAGGSSNAFYSGTLTMSGVVLVVDSGVTLFGSGYSGELLSIGGTNAGIMGPGTIDGRGDLIGGSARLVDAKNITNFVVYDVTMQNPGKEHLYVEGGNGFTAWNLSVRTPANTKNTDGIDIDSLTNATIYGSFIEDGDDGIAIKTNSAAASNITIKNNTFHGTHGMSIGSQTFDSVTNVLWEGNTVYATDEWGNLSTDDNGIRIKTDPTCGGTVRQVTYLDTCMTGLKHLLVFDTTYGACTGTSGTPFFTDIVVNGLYSTASAAGGYSEFEGYSEAYPLGLTLENVQLDATSQENGQFANVALYDSNVTPAGTGVTTTSISGAGGVPTCAF
jgi:polygalacturonase